MENYLGFEHLGGVIIKTGVNPYAYILNNIKLRMSEVIGSPRGFTFSVSSSDTLLGNLIGGFTPLDAGLYTYRMASLLFFKPNTEYLVSAMAPNNPFYNYFRPAVAENTRVHSPNGWSMVIFELYSFNVFGQFELVSTLGFPFASIDVPFVKPAPPPMIPLPIVTQPSPVIPLFPIAMESAVSIKRKNGQIVFEWQGGQLQYLDKIGNV
ncbi:MAG: hypothetical protein M2R45_05264 [Verrucomicrobia subdivision 3 bacterium]|nr:hypothetical protein [Limisphaerales bacterium]MCS1412691.1 hypothetical protein [Limisphaerales bacterium]